MPVQTIVTNINLAVGNASATHTFTAKFKSLIICSTQNIWININEATAIATTGFYLQAGVVCHIPIMNPVQISYIRSSTDGRLTIMALK